MDEHSERYFPKHKMERDIGLAEYNLAAEKLKSEDQALNWSTNSSLLIFSIASFGAFRLSEYRDGIAEAGLDEPAVKIIVLVAILTYSLISILNISNLIRSRAFSERKIITVRRMLGVTYGENNLVLPNWRVEGADNPFVIRIFPGYASFRSSPLWIIGLASSVSIYFLLPRTPFEQLQAPYASYLPGAASAAWLLFCIWVFRRSLNEANENFRLQAAKLIGRLLQVPLVRNFENTIYQVRLEIAEAYRIKADFTSIRDISVAIEDAQFYSHRGVNWRGVARAIRGRLRGRQAGGGSSITQQFSRSNFITRLENTFRRKFVEMILAWWINSVMTKSETIDGYLTTARFGNNLYGFHRAFRHYFHEPADVVQPWEAFFLVERLGNVKDRFLGNRVEALLRKLMKASLLTREDAIQVLVFYQGLVDSKELVSIEKSPSEVRSRISLENIVDCM